jgi:hypothetical protein
LFDLFSQSKNGLLGDWFLQASRSRYAVPPPEPSWVPIGSEAAKQLSAKFGVSLSKLFTDEAGNDTSKSKSLVVRMYYSISLVISL